MTFFNKQIQQVNMIDKNNYNSYFFSYEQLRRLIVYLYDITKYIIINFNYYSFRYYIICKHT